MCAEDKNRRQANQYDKIIKENLDVTLPVIIRDVLGLDIKESLELPDGLQHTKERRPDVLQQLKDAAGETYVLHLEFQVADEKGMVFRMAEYSIMLVRKYKIPVKQYVIFLKDKKPTMPTQLDTEHHQFNFRLFCLADANYKLFLKSNNPKVKMLGLLANFDQEDVYLAIKSIVDGMESQPLGDLERHRYHNQMRVLVQLRSSIEQQFERAMIRVSDFYREENDYLYRRGAAKGEVKKSRAVIENLIVKLGLTDEQAADVVEVDLNFVKNVRDELTKLKESKKQSRRK